MHKRKRSAILALLPPSFSWIHLLPFELFDEAKFLFMFELLLICFVRKKTEQPDQPDKHDERVQPICDPVGEYVVLLRPSGEEEPNRKTVKGRNAKQS